jgi:hypothetical protein
MESPLENLWVSGVSADGSIVVGYVRSSASFGAVVWNVGGVHRLQDLLMAAGVREETLRGWTLAIATSVSADGRVIVGGGINPAGQWQARIARP